MDPLDRLLREELRDSLDRIAGSAGEGTLAFVTAYHPNLRARLEEAEARLAGLRLELLDRYTAWSAALRTLEDLWALAELKRSGPDARDVIAA